MQIQKNSILSFQSHLSQKKFVLLDGIYKSSKNNSFAMQKTPDLSFFLEKPNFSVLFSTVSFYNQVKSKILSNSQKRLQNLNKLV